MCKKIKINDQVYAVFKKDMVARENGCGRANLDFNEIYVSNELPKSKQEATLAHELMHVLLCEAGLRPTFENYDEEEKFVLGIEATLYSFLKHNTDFFRK